MEVILLENYRKLGKVGDVIRVRNGFARNFLIPNKKAILATENNKSFFDSKKAEIEKENNQKIEEATKSAAKIDKKIVTLIRQAGEDGRLYGSVTAADIAEAIKSSVDRKHIILDKPVKTIGIFPIAVNLHGDVFATVNINVARSEDEAKDAAAKFKKGEYVNPTESKKKSLEEIASENEPAPQAEEASSETKPEENTAA